MKKLFLLIVLFSLVAIVSCNGQPKNNYEIYSGNVAGATKYLFFLEKKSAVAYKLIQGMDYLSPVSVITLKVGEAPIPVFTVNLNNDGAEYTVGVIAENVEGYYSGMGIAVANVGVVPSAPASIGLRKK